MTRKDRYEYILQYFRKQMPEVQTELEFGSVFQLLVAVILLISGITIRYAIPLIYSYMKDKRRESR